MFKKHNPPNDITAIRYKDYYTFDEFRKFYIYKIKLENYQNNETWPLDNCIKCSLNLLKHSADKLNYKLGKDDFHKDSAIILVFVCVLFSSIAYAYDSFYYIFMILCILAGTLIFIALAHYSATRPIEMYYCPKCKTLLYSKSPAKILSTDPPNIVFPKLERARGFKLKQN